MRRIAFALFALLAAAEAHAQIVRPRFQVSQPSMWVSASGALQNAFSVQDGATNSVWQFGSGYPLGVAVEKALTGGVTAGVRGSTGRIPLTYTSGQGSYTADARVSQVMGTVRLSSGSSFHSVFELSAGVTHFSEFRERNDGFALAPMSGDTDFSFSFGYGFGYSFNPRFAIDVVQDQTTAIHQKDGLAASDDSSNRFGMTRLIARIGLGGR